MIGKPRRVSLLVGRCFLVLGLVLTGTGCLQRTVEQRPDASGGELSSASARGDNGNGTYTAPRVPPGPAVVVAQDGPYTAYNNTTAETRNINNTLVLNQVLAAPFVVDGNGAFLLNTDVMVSAALTSRDPQVVTYRIKPGVTWSDGAPWDCDDFYLAWLAGSGKAVLTGPDGAPVPDAEGNEAAYFKPATTRGYRWANGECRDDLTFVETYFAPYADWRHNYVRGAVLPAHVLERTTGIADITALGPESAPEQLKKAGDAWNSGWAGFAADRMPASGPYRIADSQPGGPTVLVRNETWAGRPGGPERLVFTPVADGAAALRGLVNRQVDVIAPQADPVLADQLRALAQQGVVFEARSGPETVQLDLNLADPLLRAAEVRAGFAQCVDRNELVDELVRGVNPMAQPQGSLAFLPGDAQYQDRYADAMPADPQEAQLTLERAGWVLGSDGVYSRQGRRLSFAISHDGSATSSQAVELIRKQCRQAGMEITEAVPAGGVRAAVARGGYAVAVTTSPLLPHGWSLTDRFSGKGEQNPQSYRNPQVDQALSVARTQYDESVQAAALRKADQLLAADLVSLPLFQIPIMWAYRDDIGTVFRPDGNGVTWNANEWTVRPR